MNFKNILFLIVSALASFISYAYILGYYYVLTIQYNTCSQDAPLSYNIILILGIIMASLVISIFGYLFYKDKKVLALTFILLVILSCYFANSFLKTTLALDPVCVSIPGVPVNIRNY